MPVGIDVKEIEKQYKLCGPQKALEIHGLEPWITREDHLAVYFHYNSSPQNTFTVISFNLEWAQRVGFWSDVLCLLVSISRVWGSASS